MAVGEGFIGTNNGMGQGLAYVLPQSKSEDYALKMAQDESRLLANKAAAKLKREQGIQDSIAKQFASQKLPALYAPYNAAVTEANKAWQTKAADYSAKTGKSPFTNPELTSQYNNSVNGLAAKSKVLGDKYTKLYSTAAADGGNKYTPESVKNVLDYEQEIQKDPMGALNKPLPELKMAGADFTDFSKLIKPTGVSNDNGTVSTTKADRAAHIDQTLSTLMGNPEKWGTMAKRDFGLDLTAPTFPIKGVNGRNVYPTNDVAVNKIADNILSQQDAPLVLGEFGIKPDDEFAKEKLVQEIKLQNQGVGKLLTQSADLADAKVAQKYNYDNWREKAANTESRIRSRPKASSQNDEAALYRQNEIDDIWKERNSASGAGNAVERLKGVVEANPLYQDANTSTMFRDSGRWINITIPERKVAYTTTDAEGNEVEKYRKQDAYQVRIDKRNPQDKVKLNKVLDVLKGTKISEDKLQTGNAGGKIKTDIYSERGEVPKSVTSKFKNVPKGGF